MTCLWTLPCWWRTRSMSQFKSNLWFETLLVFIMYIYLLVLCFCLLPGRNDRPDWEQYGPVGGLCGEGRGWHQEGRQVPAGGSQGENRIKCVSNLDRMLYLMYNNGTTELWFLGSIISIWKVETLESQKNNMKLFKQKKKKKVSSRFYSISLISIPTAVDNWFNRTVVSCCHAWKASKF